MRLKVAVQHRDALTICELLFPFGEHQSLDALEVQLRNLDTPPGRAGYEASIKRCAAEFASDPRNFTAYSAALRDVSLGPIFVHGDTATTDPGGVVKFVGATRNFVKAAGEWRLLIGVQ